MSLQLRHFLSDAYESRHLSTFPHKKTSKEYSIQIDDQDDSDKLHEFCNVFCTVLNKDTFRIELLGNFPITAEMADLAEIYNGKHDSAQGRLVVTLNLDQIDVLTDLADKIRKTSFTGIRKNPSWLTVSSRTISTLYRFVRIIKEFTHLKNSPQT